MITSSWVNATQWGFRRIGWWHYHTSDGIHAVHLWIGKYEWLWGKRYWGTHK